MLSQQNGGKKYGIISSMKSGQARIFPMMKCSYSDLMMRMTVRGDG